MKKYELTEETLTFLGWTLYRIKAKISFGVVAKGELGGFIESEKNLADNSGDARVYGNAWVSPINIGGLKWIVTITDSDMMIGCKSHSHEDWAKFTKAEIADMAANAAEFWTENKDMLLALCKRQAKAAAKKTA